MRRNWLFILVTTLSLGLTTYLLVRHAEALNLSLTNFAISYFLMFAYMALNMLASVTSRPHEKKPDFDYDALTTDVFIPVYNEAPELLAAGILSTTEQSKLPNALWIVDDGSDESPLEHVKVRAAIDHATSCGIRIHTHRQVNKGKRHAQAYGFQQSRAAIFVTVDSDTVLAPTALAELTYAFADPRVMSVGGMAVGQNHKHSLLTRVIELGFVMAFLSGRLAEGAFGAVRVNCGILAAYRRDVVQENLLRYLGQTWLGDPVLIGDDRVLTIFARERGRAEFQATAVAYSALPTKFTHLIRQRLRWARSWYWGTLWLFRRPVRTPEFWFTVVQVLGMVAYLISISFALTNIATGHLHVRFLGFTVLASIAIGYISTLRYVISGRPDESVFSRLTTWLLSPLSSVLYMFALVPLYWYAGLRLKPKGWGTRKRVEVGMMEQRREAA